MRKALVTLAFCAFSAGSVSAQEVYLDDADDYDDSVAVEAPAYDSTYDEDDPVVVEDHAEGIVVGPRVYGWSAERPENCGTFRYWNGEVCADARFDPPPNE